MKERQINLYKELVLTLSNFSTADRANVGALLLKEGRIVATGYNGHLPGWKHECIMQDGHDIATVHAEANLIAFAAKEGISTRNCEIFVSHFPCQLCTKMLIQAGISKVYYVHDYRNEDNLFKDGIEIEKVK